MASIFTKIIQREIPAYILAEDENFIAFLDVFPLVKGHALVVPKMEVNDIFDLDTEVYKGLYAFAQQLGLRIREAIPCKRVGVAVIGLEVPHAHIHLVPLQSVDDINFTRPKLSLSPEELSEVQRLILAVD